jgi:tRNA A37 threonylcarbamoyladenosine biosynthesis protein TsaE
MIVKRIKKDNGTSGEFDSSTVDNIIIKPYTIVIRGDQGSGKSLFARSLLVNLKQFELMVAQ